MSHPAFMDFCGKRLERPPRMPTPSSMPVFDRWHTFLAQLQFLGAFARAPLLVGAIWPSSRALARLVVSCCQLQPGATVVELGAGIGAFTELLLRGLHGQGRILAMEINPTNAAILRRRFPHCEVIQDTAANLLAYLQRHSADCILSGLAWGNMPARARERILQAVLEGLKANGRFVAFAYVHAAWLPTSLEFRRWLRGHFPSVETTPVVWRNLPPAFVFRCRRG